MPVDRPKFGQLKYNLELKVEYKKHQSMKFKLLRLMGNDVDSE